jgi:hypothetical protein
MGIKRQFLVAVICWSTINFLLASGAKPPSQSPSGYKHITDWKSVENELPPKPDCRVQVKSTITVKGTLDGKGCLYEWRGAGYPKNCHAPKEISEDQPPMFVLQDGAKLRNMQIECALDGVHAKGNNVLIENVLFRDVEEDAITTSAGNNITIRKNTFFLCQDKCIQLNGPARNVLIEDNHFQHAARPLSGSASKGGATKITARGNTCKNCEIMFRMQSNHDLLAEDNYLEDGRDMFETVDKSVIYDCGRNIVKNANYKSKKGNNNIKNCPSSASDFDLYVNNSSGSAF